MGNPWPAIAKCSWDDDGDTRYFFHKCSCPSLYIVSRSKTVTYGLYGRPGFVNDAGDPYYATITISGSGVFTPGGGDDIVSGYADFSNYPASLSGTLEREVDDSLFTGTITPDYADYDGSLFYYIDVATGFRIVADKEPPNVISQTSGDGPVSPYNAGAFSDLEATWTLSDVLDEETDFFVEDAGTWTSVSEANPRSSFEDRGNGRYWDNGESEYAIVCEGLIPGVEYTARIRRREYSNSGSVLEDTQFLDNDFTPTKRYYIVDGTWSGDLNEQPVTSEIVPSATLAPPDEKGRNVLLDAIAVFPKNFPQA